MQVSIQSIINQAIESIRLNFYFFLGITLVFFILNAVLELVVFGMSVLDPMMLLISSMLSLAFYVKQAVVVHRTVILNEGGRWDKVMSWRLPESSFFLLTLLLWLLFTLFAALMGAVLAPFILASSYSDLGEPFIFFFSLFLIVMGGLAFSYICLMLPARAAGKRMSVTESISLTKPSFFKVLLLVAVLPIVTNLLVDQLLSEDVLAYNLFISLFGHLLVVFQVSILSHTYIALVGKPTTETPEILGI